MKDELQPDFFETQENELTQIWKVIEEMRLSHRKIQRRLFAEIKNLEDEIVELRLEKQKTDKGKIVQFG